MKFSLLRTAVAGVVSLLLFSAAAEAQIVNGGFESPSVPVGNFTQVAGGGNFGGWSVGGHDVLVINNTYTEASSGGITFNAHSGTQSLDITGAGNTSPLNSISQSFATTTGQAYSLSFYLGNAQTANGGFPYTLPSSVSLSATGNPLQLFTNANTTPGFVNWAQQTYLFTANGSSTTITFMNATPSSPTTDNFAGLDSITLTAVPEPASLAVWGAVSALGAAFGWRRRGRAS